jgi:hypothetical protein
VLIHFALTILKFVFLDIATSTIYFPHIFQNLPEFQKLKFIALIPDQVLSMALRTYFQLALVAAARL